MNPNEIVGTGEVAKLLNVTPRTALRYTRRDDFPRPVGELGAGRFWDRSAVERWAAKTLPLARDPRQKSDQ